MMIPQGFPLWITGGSGNGRAMLVIGWAKTGDRIDDLEPIVVDGGLTIGRPTHWEAPFRVASDQP